MGLYGRSTKQTEGPRPKPHVKKGDTVVVLSGKDRGKQGRVLRVLATKGKAIVERVNFTKKHTVRTPARTSRAASSSASRRSPSTSSRFICRAVTNRPMGSHRNEEGVAIRFCRKCKADLAGK